MDSPSLCIGLSAYILVHRAVFSSFAYRRLPKNIKRNLRRIIMPTKKKNISHNFRGKEDIFFAKIKKGLKRFLAPPSAHQQKKKGIQRDPEC